MNDIIAIWTLSGLRFSVKQGTLELEMREAALGGPKGWFYRFESDEGWMLVDLADVSSYLFVSKPTMHAPPKTKQEAERRYLASLGIEGR